jgi:hypothetical protein
MKKIILITVSALCFLTAAFVPTVEPWHKMALLPVGLFFLAISTYPFKD